MSNSPSDTDAGKKVTTDEFRMWLQLETSLLIWVRTSLALMGFGFVVARFGLFLREIARATTKMSLAAHPRLALINNVLGAALILLGAVVLLVSVHVHTQRLNQLKRGEWQLPTRWSLVIVLSYLVVAIGVAMASYLTAVEL